PHLETMAVRLADVLKIERAAVNVKVKSGEGLDAVGREEAIAAQAVCMIEAVKAS
ncbi:MAG: 2-C-methyl-D-erythritol 2,4-cyclodiphosphate synthase, partial [Nitrospirota bacterium]|nr:2-C-methyl-D-erythritol 2,4-cyclodiphosphate synthase [Nitrospirota bacterium]